MKSMTTPKQRPKAIPVLILIKKKLKLDLNIRVKTARTKEATAPTFENLGQPNGSNPNRLPTTKIVLDERDCKPGLHLTHPS